MLNRESNEKLSRILMISHDSFGYGASRSLLELIKGLKGENCWDMHLVVRQGYGELATQFKTILPTDFYYKNKNEKENKSQHLLKKSFQPIQKRSHFLTFLQLNINIHKIKLLNNIRRWNPQIIYSNTVMNGDILKSLKLYRIPTIVHVRELETYLSKLDSERLNILLKRPTMYFAVSDAVKCNLVNNYGITGDKIEIVPPSIDFENIEKYRSKKKYFNFRYEYNLPEEATVVGAIGRADDRKGTDLFFQVAEIILMKKNEHSNIYFLWVGDGPNLEKLKTEVSEKGFGNKFIFSGEKSNPYPYMNGMDILFMCSREDPFPRVNLEAGALRKPIIAFRESGGSCEFVSDDCGYVINNFNLKEVSEKIVYLANNTLIRDKFGNTAFQKVRNRYTTAKVTKLVSKILRSLSVTQPYYL